MARVAEADRERVRYHLGYLNIEPVSAIQLGFPSAQQAQFLVESAMDRLIPQAINRVLSILCTLDKIECQMVDALSRLKVQQVGEAKFRNTNDEPSETDLLEKEYARWAKRLADHLGVPLNTFCERFTSGMYGGGMSVPVSPP